MSYCNRPTCYQTREGRVHYIYSKLLLMVFLSFTIGISVCVNETINEGCCIVCVCVLPLCVFLAHTITFLC